MTRKQKIEVKMSECRERLGKLLDLETRSEEQNKELKDATLELRSLETDLQAAVALDASEPEEQTTEKRNEADAEERERLELRSKFSVGRFIGWKAGRNALDGVENEYMAAVQSEGRLPISVFERETRSDNGNGLETRAVTPGGEGGTNQRPIVPAVFQRSVAQFLGISMPDAGIGDVAFPVLSTKPAGGVGVKAKGAALNADAGAFTVSTQQPRRIGAAFTVRVEDLARLSGMEEALRTAIQGVIAEKLDDEILNGAAAAYNTDGQIRGLLVQLTDPAAPSTGAEDWTRFHNAATSHLKDPWALTERDIRLLFGEDTYRYAASMFRANETTESFPAYWNRVGGGVRLSGKIAAPASNIQQAVVVRMNPANDQAAVMPAWSGFDMTVRDVYSEASKGHVTLTVHMLVGDVVLLRSDVYVKDSFRLA